MSDNMMPELTLNPTEAAQEAVPELTLTPEAPAAPETEKKEVEPVKVDESMLTEQEKKAVDDFAKKIDITDTNLVLNYGVAAQKSVATFSENALSSVRNKDLGEVGETLSNLVVEVKGFGQEEKKGFAGLFHKQKDKLELMRAQYGKAETSVNRIVSELEKHQVTLMKDIAMLDQMYELNLKYYKELTMYIIGRARSGLDEVRTGELEELRDKAEAQRPCRGRAGRTTTTRRSASALKRSCTTWSSRAWCRSRWARRSRTAPEQRHADGRKDPVLPRQYHPPRGRARWCWHSAWSTAVRPRPPRAP